MSSAFSLAEVITQEPSLLDYSFAETLGRDADTSQRTVADLATESTIEGGEPDCDVVGQKGSGPTWTTIEHNVESTDHHVEHGRSNSICEKSTRKQQPSLSMPDSGATSCGEREAMEHRDGRNDDRYSDRLSPPRGHEVNKTRRRVDTRIGKTEDVDVKNGVAKLDGHKHPACRLNKVQCDYDTITAKVNCRRSPRNTPPGDTSMSSKFGPASRWGELSKAHLEFRRLGTAGECRSCGEHKHQLSLP